MHVHTHTHCSQCARDCHASVLTCGSGCGGVERLAYAFHPSGSRSLTPYSTSTVSLLFHVHPSVPMPAPSAHIPPRGVLNEPAHQHQQQRIVKRMSHLDDQERERVSCSVDFAAAITHRQNGSVCRGPNKRSLFRCQDGGQNHSRHLQHSMSGSRASTVDRVR
jgi:hypothetical protein